MHELSEKNYLSIFSEIINLGKFIEKTFDTLSWKGEKAR